MHKEIDMKKFALLISFAAFMFAVSCTEEEEPRSITVTWTFVTSVSSDPIAGVQYVGTTSNGLSFEGRSNASGEGSLTFDGTGEVDVRLTASHQSFGSSSFTISVPSEESDIQRTLEMMPSFQVTVDNSSLDFGPLTTELALTLSNPGTIPVNYRLGTVGNELTVSSVQGEIPAEDNLMITIALDRSDLDPGENTGNFTISIEELNQNITVSYRYSVLSPDELNWVDEDEDGLIDIRNIDDLYRLSLEVSRDTFESTIGFELIKDLDFGNPNDYKSDTLQLLLTSGEGWLPIALSSSFDYNKIFEGNDFTIRNLFMERSTNLTSLIAETTVDAVVRNVHVEIKSITGARYTSGIVGWNRGTISNCSVFGRMICGSNSGLIAGSHAQGVIESCFTEGSIVSSGANVGGIAGSIAEVNNQEASISFSYSKATIFGTGCIGGLVGCRVRGIAKITSCYAMGSVTASGRDIGGLAGGGAMTVSSCYARGDVSSEEGELGGLIGTAGTVLTSYSTGRVRGSFRVGGLAGVAGTITGSNYWDTTTSGINSSAGLAVGRTTVELQGQTTANGIYITWDVDVWDFGTTNQYPALKNMPNGLAPQR